MYKKRAARVMLLFANINLLLFCGSLCHALRPSLLKVAIVVIQKFCYHGNGMSHFSL